MSFTGYKIYLNRRRLILDENGTIFYNGLTWSSDLTEPNSDILGNAILSGIGPYFPPVYDDISCPIGGESTTTTTTTTSTTTTTTTADAPITEPTTSTTTTTTTVAPTTTTTTTTVAPTTSTTTTTTTVAPTTTTSTTTTTTTTAFNLSFLWSPLSMTVDAIRVNGVSPTLISGTDVPFSADTHQYNTTQVGTQTLEIDITSGASGQNIAIIDSDLGLTCSNILSVGSFTVTFTNISIDNITPVIISGSDGACS